MSQKRSIFEDVGESSVSNAEKKSEPRGGMIDAGRRDARGAIRVWLKILFLLVVAMVVVGGLTRLTDSGLSITEWRPITGAVPPISAEAWAKEFDKYRQIPEYQLQNKGMRLSEFLVIYWWEWGHRQLGRVVGLVWAVGFFGLLAARKIPTGWTGRLAILGGLGGLQGAIGWWMVSSGLEGTMLDVASYRLATHLGLAVIILGFITWYLLMLKRDGRELLQARRTSETQLFTIATIWLYLIFFQILLGALVAGIDAGQSYTDWPLMGGKFIPDEFWKPDLGIRNFFENAGFVQFIHRMAGYILFAYSIYAWLQGRKSAHTKTQSAFTAVFILLLFQVALGIVTVFYGAPWEIAIVHQLAAVAVFVTVLRARFLCNYPIIQSVRGQPA